MVLLSPLPDIKGSIRWSLQCMWARHPFNEVATKPEGRHNSQSCWKGERQRSMKVIVTTRSGRTLLAELVGGAVTKKVSFHVDSKNRRILMVTSSRGKPLPNPQVDPAAVADWILKGYGLYKLTKGLYSYNWTKVKHDVIVRVMGGKGKVRRIRIPKS